MNQNTSNHPVKTIPHHKPSPPARHWGWAPLLQHLMSLVLLIGLLGALAVPAAVAGGDASLPLAKVRKAILRGLQAQQNAKGATVSTDKSDYPPGAQVT